MTPTSFLLASHLPIFPIKFCTDFDESVAEVFAECVVGNATAGECGSGESRPLPRAFEKRVDAVRLPLANLAAKEDVGMRGACKSGTWYEKSGCGS